MITSPQNEKLKLVRRLASRRGREREGLFVTEGEDLAAAGLAAGAVPRFLLRPAGVEPGAPDFDLALEVEPELLAGVSALGSGTRLVGVWPETWAPLPAEGFSVFLDRVADPGNIGTILRSTHALTGGTVVLGPDCADPYGGKSIRASMGSVFARPPARGQLATLPRPWLGLVAHGGHWPILSALKAGGRDEIADGATICLGSEREGLSTAIMQACDALITIPLPGGAESLNVAAAAAICLERVSSLAVLATGSGLNSPNEGTDA